MSDVMLSTKEAGKKLALSPEQVRRLLEQGKMKGKKVGRDWVVLSLNYKGKRKTKQERIYRNILWFSVIFLLILGALTMSVSYDKDFISKLPWDPSMVGLGAAIIAISLFALDKVLGK